MAETISLGADHGAYELKEKILVNLESQGYTVIDHGTESASDSVDYPAFAKPVCEDIQNGKCNRGILVCGTGIGMSIAANKFKGIRAALISDVFSARATREHNDSNVLCMGARVINHDRALDFVKIWLETDYEGGRHQRRLDLIAEIENSQSSQQ